MRHRPSAAAFSKWLDSPPTRDRCVFCKPLTEPDFDALRGRADFQELVLEAEAKVESAPETAPMPPEKK